MLPSPEPRYFRAFQQRSAGWPGSLLALLCGALVTLSLAPFGVWPLGIVATCLLRALLEDQPRRVVIWRSWLFGIGLFGSGTSWVYVSIQQHGNASVMLASFLVVLFCLGLALLFNFTAGVIYSLTNRPHATGQLAAVPRLYRARRVVKNLGGYRLSVDDSSATPISKPHWQAGRPSPGYWVSVSSSRSPAASCSSGLSGKGRRLPLMAASVAVAMARRLAGSGHCLGKTGR